MTHLLFAILLFVSLVPPIGRLDEIRTQALPILPPEQRIALRAVGRVNGAGFRSLSICTGTLIAPDLVVTAAHCSGLSADGSTRRQFVAGWDRGNFAAHRSIRRGMLHPAYEAAQESAKYGFDIALLWLDEPIDPDAVAPIHLTAPTDKPATRGTLLGYHTIRPHALNGRSDCALLQQRSSRLRLYNCEVIKGNSGGPVLEQTQNGLILSGVIVARSGPEGQALAVKVDRWLYDAWSEAMARAGKPAD